MSASGQLKKSDSPHIMSAVCLTAEVSLLLSIETIPRLLLNLQMFFSSVN